MKSIKYEKSMKRLIIKIEEKQIFIVEMEKAKDELTLSRQHTFDLPEYIHDDFKNQPEPLADFIDNSIQNTDFQKSHIVLLFDGILGFFKEYRLKKNHTQNSDKLFHMENDSHKKTKESLNISQRFDYSKPDNNKGMSKTAIYGIDEGFFREFVRCLKNNNIEVEYATSSLILYEKSLQKLLKITEDKTLKYERVIGLDLEEKSFRAVIMDGYDVLHMEEFTLPEDAGPEDKNLTDVLTELLKEHKSNVVGSDDDYTLVIVSGNADSKIQAKRLMQYSGLTCHDVWFYKEKIEKIVKPADENWDRECLSSVFYTIGLDTKKDRDESYLYGGWSKRRFSKATTRLCIATGIIIALLFTMLPAYNWYLYAKHDDNISEISKAKYEARLDLLNENRDILSKLQVYESNNKTIEESSSEYSDVLIRLNEDLFKDATINEMFYDDKSGLMIDFNVTDIEAYEKARDKINEERQMNIAETSATDSHDHGRNYQIKVTIY